MNTSVAQSSRRPPARNGRVTAEPSGSITLFLVGFRINRITAVGRWLPVVRSMIPILRQLRRHPELGLLNTQRFLYPRGMVLVQYWSSLSALETFARDPSGPHWAAWHRYLATARESEAVAVWHERYVVDEGSYEAVYQFMRPFGLLRALEKRKPGRDSSGLGR